MLHVNAGVFPDDPDTYARFCGQYLQALKQVDLLGAWYQRGEWEIARGRAGIRKAAEQRAIEPYYHPQPWSRALEGKRVLVARALAEAGEATRLAGMVLVAPAVDLTEALMWSQASQIERRELMEKGVWDRPSEYSHSGYRITRALIEDGRRHLLFGATIRSHCPTRILQGMRDADVPYRHALTLVEHMAGDPVTLTLIKEGDHRLSRPQDLALILEAVDSFV